MIFDYFGSFENIRASFGALLFFFSAHWAFRAQVTFGNMLKHQFPRSFLRRFWWSMCDQQGGCEFCKYRRIRGMLNTFKHMDSL